MMTTREVTLEGGSPWGFRMHGGVDVHLPLKISRVNPGSKASLKGVREGDLITSINGRSTKEITNSEAHTLLKSAGDRLVLGLNEDCQNSPKRRQYKTILHHHRQEVVHETSKTSTSTSHTTLITTNNSNSSTNTNTNLNTNQKQEETATANTSGCNFNTETYKFGDENQGQKLVNIDVDVVDGKLLSSTSGRNTTNGISETPKKSNGLVRTNTNPFRQESIDFDLDFECISKPNKLNESEYEYELYNPINSKQTQQDQQQEVDETPCVSTATPTPTLTPTSSHYSSDTKDEPGEDTMPQRKKKNRKNKKGTCNGNKNNQNGTKVVINSGGDDLSQEDSVESESKTQNFDVDEDLAELENVNIPSQCLKDNEVATKDDSEIQNKLRKDLEHLNDTTNGTDSNHSEELKKDKTASQEVQVTKDGKQQETDVESFGETVVVEDFVKPQKRKLEFKTFDSRLNQIEITEISSFSLSNSANNSFENIQNYRVESPKLLNKSSKSSKLSKITSANTNLPSLAKSKSLDDLDSSEKMKITELKSSQELLDSCGRTSELPCNEAYISEISESDSEGVIDWETTGELQNSNSKKLSTQEEEQLRYFIDKLNLPGATGVPRVEEDSEDLEIKEHKKKIARSSSAIRQKRNERKQLMQYFAPMYDNPRFLEAITEESGDASKDGSSRKHRKHVKSERIEMSSSSEEIVDVVKVKTDFIEKGRVEVVVLDSGSSGDDIEDEGDTEDTENTEADDSESIGQQTPPPSPEKSNGFDQNNKIRNIENRNDPGSSSEVSRNDTENDNQIQNIPRKDYGHLKEDTGSKDTEEEKLIVNKSLGNLEASKSEQNVEKIQKIPPPLPKRNFDKKIENKSKVTDKCVDSKENIQYTEKIIKDIFIEEEIKESTKSSESFEITVNKIYGNKPHSEFDLSTSKIQTKPIHKETESETHINNVIPDEEYNPNTNFDPQVNNIIKQTISTNSPTNSEDKSINQGPNNNSENDLVKKLGVDVELNKLDKEIDAEIAVVEQKILQTQLNIAHDQALIDQLQNSLEKDKKDIKEAQSEIEHMKSFEKEFQAVLSHVKKPSSNSETTKCQNLAKKDLTTKDVLEKPVVGCRGSKERSTSRSSESSNSSGGSVGTTVILNPSLKDMASISAEAEAAEKKTKSDEQDLMENKPRHGEFNPLMLKELCVKLLIDLPFGKDALEELASVSDSLKAFTDSLPGIAYKLINQNKHTKTKNESFNSFRSELQSEEVILTENAISKSKEVKTSHETYSKSVSEVETEEISVQGQVQNVDITGSKKLLDIIMREKLSDLNSESESNQCPVSNLTNLEELNRLHEARLSAKDKSEWLHLVRSSVAQPGPPLVPKRRPQTKNCYSEFEHEQLPQQTRTSNWVKSDFCNTSNKNLPANSSDLSQQRPAPERPPRRRRSLPPELHVKQMQYLIEKEKQIQLQLENLESEKRQLLNQMLSSQEPPMTNGVKKRPKSVSLPPHEELRQRMYEEYQRQLAEREERRSLKVIKISLNEDEDIDVKKTRKGVGEFNDIEREFMDMVKMKNNGANSRESSAEKSDKDVLVLDGDELKVKKCPKHLQDFLCSKQIDRDGFSDCDVDCSNRGIWSPGQKSSFDRTELQRESTQLNSQESLQSNEEVSVPATPVWTPKSAGSSPVADRKEFRPVNFESPILQRKNRTKSDGSTNLDPPCYKDLSNSNDNKKIPTSQSAPGPGFGSGVGGGGDFAPRLPKAQNPTITLLQKAREGQIPPKSAAYIEPDRRRQINESPYGSQNDLIYNLRTESISDSDSERPKRPVYQQQVRQPYDGIGPTTTHGMPLGLRSEIRDANMSQWYKRMYDTIHKHRPSKYDDEEYVTIRYKQRNRARHPFATGYLSEPEAGAYDSDAALSDDKYATLDRRRVHPHFGGSSSNVFQSDPTQQHTVYKHYNSYSASTLPNSNNISKKSAVYSQKPAIRSSSTSSTRSTVVKRDVENDTTTIRYKPEIQQTQSALSLNKPGKIENYTPGKSSISESEAKKWWDEVMDIFDGWLDDHAQSAYQTQYQTKQNHLRFHIARHVTMEKQQQQKPKVPLVQPKGYLSQALKESGYESDSTLVFRRRDETAQQLSPLEQRAVYKNIQKGGDVPLHGLRKPIPDRPKEDYEFEQHTNMREYEYIPLVTESRMRSRSHSRSSSKDSLKNLKPRKQNEIFCYPVLTSFENDTFAAYKRTAPSSLYKKQGQTKNVIHDDLKTLPPNPPRRKSSRNNSTLRMIHSVRTPKVTKSLSPSPSQGSSRSSVLTVGSNRHETCFSPVGRNTKGMKVHSPRIDTKKLDSKLVRTSRSTQGSGSKCYCTERRSCSKCSREKQDKEKCKESKLKVVTKDKTFKKESKSPVDVKKAVVKQINSMNGNTSSVILAKINGTKTGSGFIKKRVLSPVMSIGSDSFKSTSIESLSTSRSSILPRLVRPNLGKGSKVSKTQNLNKPKTITKSGNLKDDLPKKIIKKPKDNPKNKEKEKIMKPKKSTKELLNTQVKLSKPSILNQNSKKSFVPKTCDLIRNTTDGFFQQLFFGPGLNYNSEYSGRYQSTKTSGVASVLSKLSNQTRRICDPTLGALKRYLNNTKPVSESKFKYLDMVQSNQRSRSTSPSLQHQQQRNPRFSMVKGWNPDHERSISLPPKLIFTQTSRPVTPTFERRPLSVYQGFSKPAPEKLIFSGVNSPVQRSRSASSFNGSGLSSRCPSPRSDILYFSETSRPVSPVIKPDRPASPIGYGKYAMADDSRTVSPSYRRIKSRKLIKPFESREFNDFDESRSSSIKSDKFKELNKFYKDLERVNVLERTTSSSDLFPKKSKVTRNSIWSSTSTFDEFSNSGVQFEDWQEVRQRQRAERELTSLYRQLKSSQEEHDFLFRTKPLTKWRRNLDRGLRIKEKSVENLRSEFEQIRKDQIERDRKLKEDLNIKRGVYKSLWRGNSVVNLAQNLNGQSQEFAYQRSQSEGRVKQKISDNEKLLNHGIGSRIWSSLSLEQVNILKNQLTEIYGNDNRFSESKSKPGLSLPKHSIDVSLENVNKPKELRVRRNSESYRNEQRSVDKSGIKSGDVFEVKKSKNEVFGSMSKSMSEDQKKLISKSLSKEILNLNIIKAKETLGAVAAAQAFQNPEKFASKSSKSLKVDQAYKKPMEPEVTSNFLDDYQKIDNTESTSESSSTKTVICTTTNKVTNIQIDTHTQKPGSKQKIKEKVIYFENKPKEEYSPIIYKPSDEPIAGSESSSKSNSPDSAKYSKVSDFPRSQSNQDLRELFGESHLNQIPNLSVPLSASRRIKYTRPQSPVLRTSYKSDRTRSLSPDSEYPKQNVTLLSKKFDEFYTQQSFKLRPRRCLSDPQLNKCYHDGEKVTELRSVFEYPKIMGRGRSRVRKSGLISSGFLKAEDRYMPHINIISKIASLHQGQGQSQGQTKVDSFGRRKSSKNYIKSRSSEDLAKILGIPVHEVYKLKDKFVDNKMSILGHMFTSSPNINELRDVAQYLTGDWYAHKYSKIGDGDVVKKIVPKRPKSTSPPREKNKLASILKRRRSTTATESKKEKEKIPFRSWWTWTPSSGKHSVHFKEPEGPPPPPPSVEHDNEQVNQVNFERETQEILNNLDLITESPRKYLENEVTIHYRTPVRQEVKEAVDEHVLAAQQADAMRKIYEADRQRKHQQVSGYSSYSSFSDNELIDRRSRRHTDNFIPSQKSPIPLNRYDDFLEETSTRLKSRPRSPEPRLVAKALYNFVGQTARELTFKKGDIIFVRRQIDKNWYEGELNAMIGLFPANYVEIVPYDGIKTTTRKQNEGQARAKYNFIAQTHLELSLAKGELVVVTRRVDDNWFEGRIGGRKGIFPTSYVEMLVDPQESVGNIAPTKPVASPAAHSLLLNGSAGGKESMGQHNYVPTFPTQDLGMSYRAKPVQITDAGTYGSLKKNPLEQLHIDIQNDPVPYKALYKYSPQNDDELELLEGDVVQVLEKCDDGWFVGTSERTGAFGTFPGNYVEKIND